MRLFNRKKIPLTIGQRVAAQRIANGIISRQKKAADYLNAKTEGISGKGWFILLMGFCLLFGGYCLHLLVAAWK